MNLIPLPKVFRETTEEIKTRTIQYKGAQIDKRLNKAIGKLPLSDSGLPLTVRIGTGEKEGYTLDVTNGRISIAASSVVGIFYAVQTLRQIFANETIYACHIEDAPDFSFRGLYHDVTRGRIPTLATLKELVDYMAYLKLNSLQLYVEHSFAFREYADSVERTGCLTAQEIRELDDYCHENFIELIPSLSCFGHLFELLEKPRYQHLQVADNYEAGHLYWHERMNHHTIDPLHPESFELVKSMIDQFMPLFRSKKFNICCDETFDLVNGKHKDTDAGELYVGFVNRLIQYVKSRGKQIMMWGDVLLQHPEQIGQIPKDVVFLNWEYDPDWDRSEQKIKLFKDNNRTQIVCPATWAWNHFSESLVSSVPNITNITQLGYNYGAKGVLNTNWGDYGDPCSLDLSLFGITYGAARSWNVASQLVQISRSADCLIYRHSGMYELLYTISEIERVVHYGDLSWMYNNLYYPQKLEYSRKTEEELSAARNHTIAIWKDLQSQTWSLDHFRQDILIALEGIVVMAELMMQLRGFEVDRITHTESWLAKYRAAWLRKNKESELAEIEKMFRLLETSQNRLP